MRRKLKIAESAIPGVLGIKGVIHHKKGSSSNSVVQISRRSAHDFLRGKGETSTSR
jgi:hypothetical protein